MRAGRFWETGRSAVESFATVDPCPPAFFLGEIMKHISMAVGLLAATALTGGASAADLVAAKPAAAYVAPVAPWGGLYLGVNLGYRWDGARNVAVVPAILPGFFPQLGTGATATTAFGNNGIAGGAQLGYNVQVGPVVAGAEADITFLGGNGGTGAVFQSIPHPTVGTIDTTIGTSHKTNWVGTLRVRGGFTPMSNLLIYATGGLAYGQTSMSYSVFQNLTGFPATGPGFSGASTSGLKTGWTLGGGAEYLFSPNWTARLEYLYYDLGTSKVASPFTYPVVATTIGATSAEARHAGHIARLGVNYKFGGWGGPVVAKY